jgi:two-component system alkaline phosphatase synthesis response regulator PhoP
VTVAGWALDLTGTVYRLLGAFAAHPGEMLTRDDLAALVWDDEVAGQGRAIDMHVSRLRAKLGAVPAAPGIVTVRGFGYRLVAAGHPVAGRPPIPARRTLRLMSN